MSCLSQVHGPGSEISEPVCGVSVRVSLLEPESTALSKVITVPVLVEHIFYQGRWQGHRYTKKSKSWKYQIHCKQKVYEMLYQSDNDYLTEINREVQERNLEGWQKELLKNGWSGKPLSRGDLSGETWLQKGANCGKISRTTFPSPGRGREGV